MVFISYREGQLCDSDKKDLEDRSFNFQVPFNVGLHVLITFLLIIERKPELPSILVIANRQRRMENSESNKMTSVALQGKSL